MIASSRILEEKSFSRCKSIDVSRVLKNLKTDNTAFGFVSGFACRNSGDCHHASSGNVAKAIQSYEETSRDLHDLPVPVLPELFKLQGSYRRIIEKRQSKEFGRDYNELLPTSKNNLLTTHANRNPYLMHLIKKNSSKGLKKKLK